MEEDLPFLGVTFIVTLQEPTLKPLRVVPDTLQYFAELEKTLNDNFDVESTFSFVRRAIDFAVIDFETVTTGVVTTGAVTNGAVTNGAVTNGAVTNGAVTTGAVTTGVVTNGVVTNALIEEDVAFPDT